MRVARGSDRLSACTISPRLYPTRGVSRPAVRMPAPLARPRRSPEGQTSRRPGRATDGPAGGTSCTRAPFCSRRSGIGKHSVAPRAVPTPPSRRRPQAVGQVCRRWCLERREGGTIVSKAYEANHLRGWVAKPQGSRSRLGCRQQPEASRSLWQAHEEGCRGRFAGEVRRRQGPVRAGNAGKVARQSVNGREERAA